MNHNFQALFPLMLFAVLIVTGTFPATVIYSRYTGLKPAQSALLWLLAVGGALITLASPSVGLLSHFYQGSPEFGLLNNHYTGEGPKPGFAVAAFVSLWILVLPFAVRLYRTWIGGHVTDAEKLPGIDGVRAWLGVGDVICATLVPTCIWLLLGGSLWGMVAVSFGLLLAYPLLKTASQSVQNPPAAPVEDLSREREKVLQLLEAGKINAEESAELLNALCHSSPPPPKPDAGINPQRKIILLGTALLLVGFFLPWFSVNPGEEMNRMMSQVQQAISSQTPAQAGNPGVAFPQMNLGLNTTVRMCGGDLAHGLGWWILSLGMVAAVLPFFATNLNGQMQKRVVLACLGVGAVLLIYLFTNNLRYASVGILFGLAGYVLEVVGTMQERPATDN